MKTADIQTADGRLVASSGTRSRVAASLTQRRKDAERDSVAGLLESGPPVGTFARTRSTFSAQFLRLCQRHLTRSPLHPVTVSLAFLVSLSLLLPVSLSQGKLPEPDAIYFGTAKHNGGATLYPSGTEMVLRAELNGVQIATATINSNGTFVLKVPVDDGQEPRIQGAARGNERVRVFLRNTDLSLETEVNESSGLGVVVPNLRGDLTDTDFTVAGDFGGLPPPPPGFDEFMGGYGFAGIPGEMNLDLDGDGFSNVEEFITGTDPTSGAAAVRIMDIVNSGNVTSVQFGPVRISRLYRIWCSEDLASQSWNEVGQVRPTLEADFRWFDLLNEGQQHLFFKVEVELE